MIIVQMFQVCCISRSNELKIDSQNENFKNLEGLEAWHQLMDLSQACSHYGAVAKNDPTSGVTHFTGG